MMVDLGIPLILISQLQLDDAALAHIEKHRANGICDKNPPIPAHNRAITRKFAEEIATTQQHCPEETKKPKIASEHFSVWEDVPLTDEPVPMCLEQTETLSMSHEKTQMEIEMEDIFEESVLDIDSEDAKNPLAVVDIVEDLYAYYTKMEGCSCVPPNYMEQQFDINERMRAILIDWLIEVFEEKSLLV